MRKENTKTYKVFAKLLQMNIGDSFDKNQFITKLYGDNNYYISRSFDVFFSKAKKKLPERQFKCLKGIITRNI